MADDRGPTLLDRIMGNPFVGLAPWILYGLVEGPSRLEASAAAALGLAILVLCVNWLRDQSPKFLEFADVVYFAALAVVVAYADDGTRNWLELWGGEMANLALVVIVLGSILLRRPFTLPYAREDTPPEYWDTPEFMRVNYLIAWVWAAAFIVQAASGLYGDAVLGDNSNIWTGWIVQTLPVIIAAQFTFWYPARLDAVREGDESAPTAAGFLATVTPWVSAVGSLVLLFGGGPEWLGIALIGVGVVATRVLSRAGSTRPGAV